MLLIYLVDRFFQFYYYLVIARVVMSWVQPPTHHQTMRKIIAFIYRATEPVLGPIREMMPSLGGIDFSPIIALLALQIVRNGVIQLLYHLF
jgi:YggT family protein